MKRIVSMFGVTNSKELILRARSQGVPVGEAFFKSHQFCNINDVATALEDAYGIKVTGEGVYPPEMFFWFPTETRTIKLQSTYVPGHFVTVPTDVNLVNDLLESGFYRVWSA